MKVHFVKKARKDIPGTDVKAGTSYYWWKFRHGGRRTSKTRPKPSQLTQSEFWGNVYGLQEGHEHAPDFDSVESEIEEIKGELEGWRDEIQDKISNLESAFPNGCPSIELLQERYDALDSCISDLDSIDATCDDRQEDEEEDDYEIRKSDRAHEIWTEVTDALSGISCS